MLEMQIRCLCGSGIAKGMEKEQKDFLLSPLEQIQDGLIQNRGVCEPGLARLFTVARSSRFRLSPEGSTLYPYNSLGWLSG